MNFEGQSEEANNNYESTQHGGNGSNPSQMNEITNVTTNDNQIGGNVEERPTLARMILDELLRYHEQPNHNENETNNIATRVLDNLRKYREESIMKNIGHENFEGLDDIPQNEQWCCICLETYVLGDEMGRLDCGHRFHMKCIKEWLLQKNVCPLCNRKGLEIF